jgi:hypothetical protein
MPESRGAWAFSLTVFAVCWSALVLAGAFWLPAYQGESSSSGGVVTHTSATLVGVNGLDAALLLALPLGLTVAAGIGLHLRCSRGSPAGGAGAWLAVGVLAALTVFGAASIGLYVLPATLLLAAAARLTPAG